MKKSRIIPYIAVLLVVSSLSGCKSMKDSKLALFYHNVTARFNGYFNAKEKMKEAEIQLAAQHKNKFNRVIDIFPTGGEEGAKSVAGDMDIIIQKCSRVIKKHEISKWVDDCYFLVGKANFYKRDYFITQETFQYVNLRFPETLPGQRARLWIVRTWIELEKPQEAQANLSVINNDKKFPAELKDELKLVEADYFIKTADYASAITRLEAVLPNVKKKNEKVRYMFILAQLYQLTTQDNKAATMYRNVIKKNPAYEFSFQSKLKLAEVSSNKEEVKKYLENLTKDDKNLSYFDQIYYVLAKIELKEGNTDKAVEYLKISAEKSTENRGQKALSYVSLADIYFEKQNFQAAKSYYDSAANFMDEDYPDYKNFLARQTVLSELINNLLTVQKQDSLLKISQMAPEQIDKLVDNIIAREKEEQQKQAAANLQNNNLQMPGIDPITGGVVQAPGQQQNMAQNSKNYFSNPTALSLGYSQFLTTWGNRPLQDNWRRYEKAVEIVEEIGGPSTNPAESAIDSSILANNPLFKDIPEDRIKYYVGIPYTSLQKQQANLQIEDALFNVGNIYYQELNQNTKAIENFESLLQRYPDTKYLLQTHYSLYRLYLAQNNTSKADEHKDFILKNYPGTDYAMLIENPEQLRERFAGKDKNPVLEGLYTRAYSSFISNQCSDVQSLRQQAMNVEKNYLEAKFNYLGLLCNGKSNRSGLRDSLQKFIARYPGDEVTKQAVDLLKYLEENDQSSGKQYNQVIKSVAKADTVQADTAKKNVAINAPSEIKMPNFIKSQPITIDRNVQISDDNLTVTPAEEPVRESAYELDFKQQHHFILIYPLSVSSSQVKVAFSNYNKTNHADKELEIGTYVLNNESQVLMVRNFKDYTVALAYYKALMNQPGFYENIKADPSGSFIISNENYRLLMKEKKTENYSKFFKENYL